MSIDLILQERGLHAALMYAFNNQSVPQRDQDLSEIARYLIAQGSKVTALAVTRGIADITLQQQTHQAISAFREINPPTLPLR